MSGETKPDRLENVEALLLRPEQLEFLRQLIEEFGYPRYDLKSSELLKRILSRLEFRADADPSAAYGVEDRGADEGDEILERVRRWAGGGVEAGIWYRSQPIAAFGDRKAESLVKSGQTAALRDYLDSFALGGYA